VEIALNLKSPPPHIQIRRKQTILNDILPYQSQKEFAADFSGTRILWIKREKKKKIFEL